MTARIKELRNFMTTAVDLNDTRTSNLRSRVDTINTFLLASEKLDGVIEDDVIPQGSFAHKTIIKPAADGEFDADVLVPMTDDEDWEPKKYTERLFAALEASARYKGKAVLRKRCVRLDYADGFHIDLVPFVTRSFELTYITHRTRNEFIRQEPPAFTKWFNDQHRNANGHLIRAVRLMKWLRNQSSSDVPSVVLTALMAERVHGFSGTSDYVNLPATFTTIATALSEYLDGLSSPPWVDDQIGQNLADRWTQSAFDRFKSQLRSWATKANAAMTADASESVDAWKKLFGDGYGAATTETATEALVLSASSKDVAPGEQDLTRDHDVSLGIDGKNTVRIVARSSATRSGRGRPRPLSARGNLVPIGRTLHFSVEDCTVEPPYFVFWKVRNDGPEATRRGMLRGEIAERGPRITESSNFSGSHWVQAWIVKDGVAIATDIQDVTIMPRA